MRFILALGALATAAGFVVPAQHGRAPVTRRQGFLEDMMDKLDGGGKAGKSAKDDWKERAYREQQAMLAERRKTGGGLSKEKELEIARRRSIHTALEASARPACWGIRSKLEEEI